MSSENINPLENLYTEFTHIIQNVVVKYNSKAEEKETLESKQNADLFIDAIYQRDDYLTYRDYSTEEYNAVGLFDPKAIQRYKDNPRIVPEQFRPLLLENRRSYIKNHFNEQNDYYRMLSGYPPLDTKIENYHYVHKEICDVYGISSNIPVHRIQDYYNNEEAGKGDKFMNVLEGLEFIKQLQSQFPTEEYLFYLGSNRIDLIKSRSSKNFEILKMDRNGISTTVYEEFVRIYEQCRIYFMTTIYNYQFRSFFPYYDNFIGMCIMIMAMQQLVAKQISSGIRRIFFDINSLRMLYEAYGMPYDLTIDRDTQMTIAQNINMMICNKSTNKVIYDMAEILGFPNIKVYKYYLAKERNFDDYGVPIVAWKEEFNVEKGERERVPDYDKMYSLYFQKEELRQDDFIQSFSSNVNRVSYEEVTDEDPFWIQDKELDDAIWNTEFNFVETKYLSLGISYRMTDILFENVLLLKLMMYHSTALADVQITIPRIIDGTNVPLFDLVILLLSLVAKKHRLTGEIISMPNQVISVLDYLNNLDSYQPYLVDTFSFNFDYFKTPGSSDDVQKIMNLLTMEERVQLTKYLSVLSFKSDASPEEKLDALNSMYTNIRGLLTFISYKMTSATNLETYNAFKTFYRAAFYAKEMKGVFTIRGDLTGHERTAKNLFEFLHYYNPKLYNAVYVTQYREEYEKYLIENELTEDDLSLIDYQKGIELGTIDIPFDHLSVEDNVDESEMWNIVNRSTVHIISKFKAIIDHVNFLYLIDDASASIVNLLVKLINFVKSLTTDMINLDTVYVCNMSQENMLKYFDKVQSIEKSMMTNDSMNLSYTDTIHGVESEINSDDRFGFTDIATSDKTIEIQQKMIPTSCDRIGFADSIHKMWYSDD